MDSNKPMRLLALARKIASTNAALQTVLGPGVGNRATQAFMQQLRRLAVEALGADYSERKICGETSLAVDFYFSDEGTIVEVALGLPNPASELEKDILKAIMAQELECNVQRLFFISRPGAVTKCAQPGRTAVREWARAKHQLAVEGMSSMESRAVAVERNDQSRRKQHTIGAELRILCHGAATLHAPNRCNSR